MELLQQWRNALFPENIFSMEDVWQLAVVGALVLVCSLSFRPKGIVNQTDIYSIPIWLKKNRGFLVFSVILLGVYLPFVLFSGYRFPVFRFFAIMIFAWVPIGIASTFLREKFWADAAALFAYITTALFALSLIDDTVYLLDSLSLHVGGSTITATNIISGIMAFALTLWVSMLIARIIEVRIKAVPRLTPSLQVLIAKVVRIVLIVVASITAISSMGVDLSALTVLGGAVGLGLGFGLQKVVSNFVSGIILLLDNSIKPGDVIEIDDTYGSVNNLHARYASVITRDGTEHLIPNEDLISQKVINWSFTDSLVRTKIPVGISYNADPHHCMKLVLEAAKASNRVLKDPPPACLLRGFGDSSVDLELRFWINDPGNGVANVQSQVLLKIWDVFKENDIEIPFPQRDLHIRSSEVIHVDRNNPDPD